jgi:hypothetical protein
MADAGLFVGFGEPVRGREAKALQVFNESLAYYARLQQEGKIESFEPVLLEPHGGDLGGFILLRGSMEQLQAVHASEEFQSVQNRARLIVDNVGVIHANIGASLASGMADYQKQVTALA